MSDPVETPAAVDAATPKTPEQFADVQASRDKAKAKLKDAEASFATQGEELAKLRAENTERAAVDASAQLESDTKAGEWQKVVSVKDERIEGLLKDAAENAAFRESTAREGRQRALVDAIATQVPGASRFEVQAMVSQLGASGADIAPEKMTDDHTAVIVAQLKTSAPSLFAAPSQTPPPRAGAGIPSTPQQHDAAHWARRINGEA